MGAAGRITVNGRTMGGAAAFVISGRVLDWRRDTRRKEQRH
jgi:hypothetical protein